MPSHVDTFRKRMWVRLVCRWLYTGSTDSSNFPSMQANMFVMRACAENTLEVRCVIKKPVSEIATMRTTPAKAMVKRRQESLRKLPLAMSEEYCSDASPRTSASFGNFMIGSNFETPSWPVPTCFSERDDMSCETQKNLRASQSFVRLGARMRRRVICVCLCVQVCVCAWYVAVVPLGVLRKNSYTHPTLSALQPNCTSNMSCSLTLTSATTRGFVMRRRICRGILTCCFDASSRS